MNAWRIAVLVFVIVLSVAAGEAAVLTGSIVDQQGQPVSGARVDIAIAAPKIGPGIFCPSCYVDCAKHTTTDDDGQFEIGRAERRTRIPRAADGRLKNGASD